MRVIVALIMLIISFQAVRSETDIAPPEAVPLASCIQIMISTGGSWTLRIAPDGSGYLSYGSSPEDSFRVPAATFNFNAIYAQIYETTEYTGDGHRFIVSFAKAGKLVSLSRKIEYSSPAIRGYFAAAEASINTGRAALEEIKAQSPFFP